MSPTAAIHHLVLTLRLVESMGYDHQSGDVTSDLFRIHSQTRMVLRHFGYVWTYDGELRPLDPTTHLQQQDNNMQKETTSYMTGPVQTLRVVTTRGVMWLNPAHIVSIADKTRYYLVEKEWCGKPARLERPIGPQMLRRARCSITTTTPDPSNPDALLTFDVQEPAESVAYRLATLPTKDLTTQGGVK